MSSRRGSVEPGDDESNASTPRTPSSSTTSSALQRLKSSRKASSAFASPSPKAVPPSPSLSPSSPVDSTPAPPWDERQLNSSSSAADQFYSNEADETSEPPFELQQCSKCGRSFAPTSLSKHQRVCERVFSKQRKQFNASNSRVPAEARQATKAERKAREHERKGGRSHDATPAAASSSSASAHGKAKWKVRSEQFRAQLQYMRQVTAAEKREKREKQSGQSTQNRSGSSSARHKQKQMHNTAPASTPTLAPADEDPDSKRCEHCGRTFKEHAYERHVKHCAETRAKPNRLKKGSGVGAHNGRAQSAHSAGKIDKSASAMRRKE